MWRAKTDLEKDAEEGNKKAKWLLKIVEQPKYFVYSLQAVTNVIGLILGSYVLRSWGSGLGLWIVKATGWDVKLERTLGLIPGGDCDFSGFDQFRYCEFLNVVAQKSRSTGVTGWFLWFQR